MTLTPKKLEVLIKNHYDHKAVAEKYGISLDDLDSELRKIFTGKAYKDINARLKSNEKMAKKLHLAAENDSNPDESEAKATDEEETATDVKSEEVNILPDTPRLSLEPCNITLDDVISSIAEKQGELVRLEKMHDSSASVRQSIRNRINAKKNELLRLQDSVKKIQLDVDELLHEFEAEEVKMKDFNMQMSEVKTELEQLESQRVELETLSILFYKDGRIEINNEEIGQDQIPEDWTFIYHRFYGKDEVDSLTGFELKNLAKFFALLKVLPNGRKQDICFESNDVEAAFELLKGGILG